MAKLKMISISLLYDIFYKSTHYRCQENFNTLIPCKDIICQSLLIVFIYVCVASEGGTAASH